MSTSIECNNCKEVVEVTATSITLPFFCETCEAAAFQDAIKPVVPAKHPPFVRSSQTAQAEADFPLNDEDATVENTTLLIEDLEEQLTLTKQISAAQQEYIESMEKTAESAKALIDEQAGRISEFAAARQKDAESYTDLAEKEYEARTLNEKLQQDISEVIGRKDRLQAGVTSFTLKVLGLASEWDAKQAELEQDVTNAEEQVAVLENKLTILKQISQNNARIAELTQEALDQANQEIAAGKREVKAWQERFRSKVQEYYTLYWSNQSLKNRGFFARVFNR